MARFRFIILIALFACCFAVLSQADIGKDNDGRALLRIDPDPNSTFEIGELLYTFPLDTVALPVYLHTAAEVAYIENRIYWEGDDLDLVSITLGPGVPDTADLDVEMLNDTLVKYDISADPFYIPSGEPIAYLNFEVQCFGYGANTYIRFVDDDYYNFYIDSSYQPYAPLRDDGRIRTDYEQYCFLYGSIEYTYPGKQDIPVDLVYYQEVPGKLLTARMVYDPDEVHIDSVIAGVDGEDIPFNVTYSGDTIIIDIPPETCPVLDHNRSLYLFELYFGLEVCDADDFVYLIPVVYGEKVNECGEYKNPSYIPGQIRVNDHTAEADLGDVWYYTTASYYDVPFVMDSNMPVNDYEFWINFPADDLTFEGIVAVGGFLAPDGDTIPGNPGLIQINNMIGTDYQPGDLPATVFKLRFAPIGSPPYGTLFDITFYETDENEVRYNMDPPCGFHTADLTLEDGSIYIKKKPGGGPGCPALYVWNGSSFEMENTILAACVDGKVEKNVTDFYLISNAVTPNSNKLVFQIREDGEEISTFSDFKLMVVDHPAEEKIKVLREGNIISIGKPFSLSWAKDHKGNDITHLLATKDEVYYTSNENGWFDISFGKLRENQITTLTAAEYPIIPKDQQSNGNNVLNSSGNEPEVVSKKLRISVQTADGSWHLISEEDARREPVRQAVVIDPGLIDTDRELVLRYSWESHYQVDVLDFHTAEPFEGEPRVLNLADAVHTEDGSILHKLGIEDIQNPVTLSPGEAIDLAFDASSLPPFTKDVKRKYIFVATGRYGKDGDEEEVPRGSFALDANFPNPFNPSTVISYNLPKAAYVELKIYDVRGALVRTLVSEVQSAGEKKVAWDAVSDSGQRVASGVYFYIMKTPEFSKTRKMILLK